MKYKARYFLIGNPKGSSLTGGQEPQEEPEVVSIEDAGDIISNLNSYDEDTIDKIIDYIKELGIDKKADTGIKENGKVEYLKKVFELLQNEISPVIPSLKGSGDDDTEESSDEDTSFRDLFKRKPSKVSVPPEKLELYNNIKAFEEEVKKFKFPKKIDINTEQVDKLLKQLDEKINAPLSEADINDITKFIMDVVNDVVKGNMNTKYRARDIFIKRLIDGVPIADIIKEISPSYTGTKEIPTNLKRIYDFLIRKRNNYTQIMDSVDIEDTSTVYPSLLTLYRFPHVLEMSVEGFNDRDQFVKLAGILSDGWDYDMELALRGEVQLEEILRDIFGSEFLPNKYPNIFQLVNRGEAWEGIDIVMKGKAFIELKGYKTGTLEMNKFLHMAKEYKNNQDAFFAVAKPYTIRKDDNYAAPGLQTVRSQLVNEKTSNVFDKFFIHQIPNEVIKHISENYSMYDHTKDTKFGDNGKRLFNYLKSQNIPGLTSDDKFMSFKIQNKGFSLNAQPTKKEREIIRNAISKDVTSTTKPKGTKSKPKEFDV